MKITLFIFLFQFPFFCSFFNTRREIEWESRFFFPHITHTVFAENRAINFLSTTTLKNITQRRKKSGFDWLNWIRLYVQL